MMRKLFLWLGLVGVLSLTACGGRDSKTPAPPPAASAPANMVILPPDSPKLAQIRVEAMGMAALPMGEVTAPGKVEVNPNRVSRVPLAVPGRVSQVLVKLGDSVTAGQPLLMITSPDADAAVATLLQNEAALTQANAALTQANAAVSKATNTQRKAQADYERAVDLFEHNAIARKELLNAENDLKQAKADSDVARAGVEQARAGIEQAKAVCEQAKRRLAVLGLQPGEVKPQVVVRAPLAGKVLDISIVAGEYRNDTTAPVMTIADLRTVWVTSDVPENSIRLIQVGESVEITFDAYPDEVFHGKAARIADTLDPKSRTVKVMIELENSRGKFRPEMFGRIRHTEAVKSMPVLPVGAIVQDGGRNIIYVEQAKGRFEMREVVTGHRSGDQVGIISGAQPGERVVVDGVMLLRS